MKCPACARVFASETGVRSHFGQKHGGIAWPWSRPSLFVKRFVKCEITRARPRDGSTGRFL